MGFSWWGTLGWVFAVGWFVGGVVYCRVAVAGMVVGVRFVLLVDKKASLWWMFICVMFSVICWCYCW